MLGAGVKSGVDTAGNKHSFPKKRKDSHYQHCMGSAVLIKNLAARASAEAGIEPFATHSLHSEVLGLGHEA